MIYYLMRKHPVEMVTHFVKALILVSIVKAMVFNQSPSLVIQGRPFQLDCEVNFTAKIQHNGLLIINCSTDADSCTSTEPTYNVSVEGSNISLRNNKSDRSRDNGAWKCNEEEIILDIKILPAVRINVSSTSIEVIKGRYFALKCVATGSIPDVPITGYTWIKNNLTIPGANYLSYTLDKVETTDEGEFKCTANNGLEKVTSSNFVKIVVLYPPIVLVTYKTFKIEENSSGIITCSAKAKPSTITYEWYSPHGSISDGPILTLTKLSRDQAGNYTCKATNSAGTNTTTTTVDVLYRPNITVTPSVNIYYVQEDTELSLNCIVSSNPPPDSFFWYNPASVKLQSDKLVISRIKRTQEGRYTCRATSTLKPTSGSAVSLNDSKSIYVGVSYLDPVKMTVSALVIEEKSKVTIACSTESRPEANTTIFKDHYTILHLQNNTVTYTINEAQCLDTGIYRCQFKNLEAPQQSFVESKSIQVRCSPRPDPRENITYTMFVHKTDVVELKASIIAFPQPIFVWHYKTAVGGIKIIKDDETFKISTRLTSTRTFVSSLSINITSDDLFNQYNVDVYNEISSTKMVFYVKDTNKTSKTHVGLIVGGAVSSFIIVVIIAIIVVFILRLRKIKQIKKREEEAKYSDLNVDPCTSETTYQSQSDRPGCEEEKNGENKTYVNLENVSNDKTYVNCNLGVSPEDSKDVYANYSKGDESVYANV